MLGSKHTSLFAIRNLCKVMYNTIASTKYYGSCKKNHDKGLRIVDAESTFIFNDSNFRKDEFKKIDLNHDFLKF